MAIKVGGTTVITDGLKLESQVVNPGRFTTAERDLLTPEIGDIIFNTDEENPEVWNGTEWGPLGGGGSDGFKDVDPQLSNFDVDFLGSGTQAVPWVVTPNLCNIGGIVYSEPITIYGLPPFSRISFEDPNTGTHGNRYQQPAVTTNSDGFVRFQLQFTDAPASSPNTDYTTVLKAGDAYFAWDVSINDLGIEAPKVESILSAPGTSAYQPMTEPSFAPFETSVGLLIATTTSTANDGSLSNVSPLSSPTGEGVLPPSGTGLQASLTISGGTVTAIIGPGAQAGENYASNEIVYFDLSSLGGESQFPMQVKLAPVSVKNAVLTTTPYAGTNAGGHSKTVIEVSKYSDMSEAHTYEFTGSELTSMTVDLSQVPIPKYTDFYLRLKYIGSTTDSNTGNPIESPWGPISLGTNGLIYSYAWSINNLPQHTSNGRNYEVTSDYAIAAEPYTYILFGRGGPGGGGYRASEGSPGTPAQFIHMVQPRQPVSVEITSVNESGAIIAYTQIEFGRGYNNQYKLTGADQGGTLIETSGSGSGFSWDFTRDADGFTIVSSCAGGSNFQIGDTIRWFPQPSVCRSGTTNYGFDMVVVDIASQPPAADGYDPYVTQGGFTFTNPSESKEDTTNDYLIQGYGGGGGRDRDGTSGPTRSDYTTGDATATSAGNQGRSSNSLPLDYRTGNGGCGGTSGGGGGFRSGGDSACTTTTGGGANWVADDIQSTTNENTINNHFFFYEGVDQPQKFLEIDDSRLYAIRVA